jgi:hypothetical protein
MRETTSLRPVYPLNDFCQEFGIRRSMAYREIKAGRLRAFKFGKLTMVAGEDALAWREQYRKADQQLAA